MFDRRARGAQKAASDAGRGVRLPMTSRRGSIDTSSARGKKKLSRKPARCRGQLRSVAHEVGCAC